jgi:dehydrogenase/reductase SDR family protein 4
MTPIDLTGKIAIVTGGTRGIGLATAAGLASAGATVVVSSRKPEAVERVTKEIVAAGGKAVGLTAHVGKMDECRKLVADTIAQLGGVDIVVNNAAANPVFGPVENTDEGAWAKIMSVNLQGPFEICKAALPTMIARGGGAIVNLSSIGGVSPEQGLGIYSVSKAAIISLTQVMAREWGRHNVRANAICPGLIRTDFSSTLWKDEKLVERYMKFQPIARIGEPDDVASMAVFLASPAASYCSGGVYMVDGGYTI